MDELDLYNYITENNIEWHWNTNNDIDDVIIMPYTFELEDFLKLINNYIDYTDEGLIVHVKNGYCCIWMNDICEYYNIELNRIFKIKN